MRSYKIIIDEKRCRNCGFCKEVSKCHSNEGCIGCLACYYSCPYNARKLFEIERHSKFMDIYVEEVLYKVPSQTTVLNALKSIGIHLNAPCRLGGCWTCLAMINGSLERTCITPVKEGMKISLDIDKHPPLRVIHGPEPHMVGGKATPWWEVDYIRYVEVAIWVAGCNLRCPQCQNYHVTYDNSSRPMEAIKAARLATIYRKRYDVKSIAISGGEPTLNKRWLIDYFKELTRLNPDIRRHLDSNGTLLTKDYIDELVYAGCNNIGIEPKTYSLRSYMKVTGIRNRDLAKKYHETAWSAIKYIADNYRDKVYLGVGLIYNSALVTYDEIYKAGVKIANIDPKIQVTVLDYFPAFKRRDISRPTLDEMLIVKEILEDAGLETVIVQTKAGHIGPKDIWRVWSR